MALSNLTPDIRDELNLPRSAKGALVTGVNQDEAAAAAGIQAGDVIVSVNDQPIVNASDVKKAVANAENAGRKSVLLLVERDGNQIFVAVPFSAA
jgi:serine protease Do